MSTQNTPIAPLVSVIIPCYNHGQYLPESIGSVLAQDYPAIEIVVVDDGSTDNTRQEAEKFPDVKYVYQPNQGLSAARNTGIQHSKGDMLIFLDADDWLLPGAIRTNLRHLQANPDAAFVSGAHQKIFVDTQQLKEESYEITQNHYTQLLQGNYIGMHATVMYRRRVFSEFTFDTSLRSCEDYDLYLNIARKHPVVHHTENIAAYRLHSTNMSGNIPMMLKSVLAVLDRQQHSLTTAEEKQAFWHGHAVWKDYYGKELYQKMRSDTVPASKEALILLLKYKPYLFLKYLLTHLRP